MRDLFTVASFTIKEMVKKKSFIVSNIIFLVIILVGTNVPRLLESLNGKSEGKKVLIVDSKNVFEGSLDSLKTEDSIYDLSITNDSYDKDKIKSVLENGDYEEVIVLDVDNQKIIFDDYQEEASLTSVPADDLMSSITNIYYGINLSKIGLSEEQLDKLNITSELNNIYIKENNSGNSIFAMMMFSIVLFYAVFFCASQVSASVTTEKTSKIIESLTTSTSPKYIVLGKTLGVGVVGLSAEEIEEMGKRGQSIPKVSRRDLPIVLAEKSWGATTVATTMILAAKAGVEFFVTGGIGGVHRGAQETFDISADLEELGRTNVTVICAGAKAILDLKLTMEVLETKGVPVLGYQTENLPAFYSRDNGMGLKVDYALKNAEDAAKIVKAKRELGLNGGVLVTNPIPEEYAMPTDVINKAISEALAEMDAKGIHGKECTPFLLAKIAEITEGKSLDSNIRLVFNNAAVGCEIAKEYCKL